MGAAGSIEERSSAKVDHTNLEKQVDGGFYFVSVGRYRVSVARYHGGDRCLCNGVQCSVTEAPRTTSGAAPE